MDNEVFGSEKVNAYVDGELSSGEAADVARAAARSPALAGQIASLRELKAAAGELVPDCQLVLPEVPRRRTGARLSMILAACLAMIIVLGGTLYGPLRYDDRPDWPSVLESHHRSWAFNRGSDVGGPINAAFEGLDVIDLSSARLTLTGYERIAFRQMTFDRVGYEGTRGCRLSLFRLPRGLNPPVDAFGASMRVRAWRDGDHDFLLMAEGMAERRFDELAAAIFRALREHRPFDDETRARLARARAASRPCRA